MREIAVVTTFNKQGLDTYGQRMIDSYEKNWPKEITLYVYAEDCTPKTTASNVVIRDLNKECRSLVAFKEKWKNVPKANGDISNDPVRSKRRDAFKGFKWDAIKFSHKVYAIFHCAKTVDADVLMWMDADMYCHSPISLETVQALIPEDKDLCYIGRERKWPECGLYTINLRSKRGRQFLSRFQWVYDNAESGIFKMEEWHDSFVFEQVRRKSRLESLNWTKGLIKGEGHPLINSEWGAYLDHLKGCRKELGKSKKTDLLKPREEYYWKNL